MLKVELRVHRAVYLLLNLADGRWHIAWHCLITPTLIVVVLCTTVAHLLIHPKLALLTAIACVLPLSKPAFEMTVRHFKQMVVKLRNIAWNLAVGDSLRHTRRHVSKTRPETAGRLSADAVITRVACGIEVAAAIVSARMCG